MKSSTLIMIGVSAACVALCGGGGFFGYRMFTNAKVVDAEADEYVVSVFPKIASNWYGSDLRPELAPEWTNKQSKEATDKWLAECNHLLGRLRSSSGFAPVSTRWVTVDGKDVTYVRTVCQAKFKNATAVVSIDLVKRENWKIGAINISHVVPLKQGFTQEAKGFIDAN